LLISSKPRNIDSIRMKVRYTGSMAAALSASGS
jgi:hypothetical protein